MINHDPLQCYVLMMAGMTFFEARRIPGGMNYFNQVMTFPEDVQGDFVMGHTHLAMAYADYQDERFESALNHIIKGFFYLKRLVWLHHRAPWALECIIGLEQRGYHLGEINFNSELIRILSWPDLYMKGVAYQWRAYQKIQQQADRNDILDDLAKSRQCLLRSGAQMELARNYALMARFYLHEEDKEKAVDLAQSSRKISYAVNEDLFPKDLEHLIVREDAEQLLLGTIINVGNSIGTIRNRTTLLERIITLIMRFTLAERGGVFLLTEPDQM